MDTSTQYDLMGKVAIVTAGGSGNSKAIALELAQAGASVVAVSRPEAEIKAVAEEIRVADRKAVAVVTNLTIREQIKNPVDLTINESCTPIWDHPERVHMYLSAVPKGRVAEPEEIAGAFLF